MENLNVYKDLIKRMLTMVDAGVTDSAPAAYRQPSSVYTRAIAPTSHSSNQ